MNGWKMILLWAGIAIAIATLAQFNLIVAWTDVHSGFAAWVQAVGSIAAIIAAALIAGYQVRRTEHIENERRRIERLGKLSAINGILNHANVCFHIGITALTNKAPKNTWKQLGVEVAQIRSVIAGLPILDLPGPNTAARIALVEQNLRTLLRFCNAIIDETRTIDSTNEKDEKVFQNMIKRCSDTMEWVIKEIASATTPEEANLLRRESL